MLGTKNIGKYLITKKDLDSASIKRDLFSDKNRSGRILIIGGSSDYHGAPVLALNSAYQSLAALRSGAGYVKAMVPRSILGNARSLSPNTVIQELGSTSIIFNDKVRKEIERAQVIAIGMGIGRKSIPVTKRIIEFALKRGKKVIVDADAIPAVRGIKAPENLLITPHDGEFQRLTGKNPSTKDLGTRIEECSKAARKINAIILLKGHYTIITDGKKIKVNRAETAALATMGTGDVLSGIIAGYAAIGNDLFTAAVAGAYLHSRIADKLAKRKVRNIIATDVIDNIGYV